MQMDKNRFSQDEAQLICQEWNTGDVISMRVDAHLKYMGMYMYLCHEQRQNEDI